MRSCSRSSPQASGYFPATRGSTCQFPPAVEKPICPSLQCLSIARQSVLFAAQWLSLLPWFTCRLHYLGLLVRHEGRFASSATHTLHTVMPRWGSLCLVFATCNDRCDVTKMLLKASWKDHRTDEWTFSRKLNWSREKSNQLEVISVKFEATS